MHATSVLKSGGESWIHTSAGSIDGRAVLYVGDAPNQPRPIPQRPAPPANRQGIVQRLTSLAVDAAARVRRRAPQQPAPSSADRSGVRAQAFESRPRIGGGE